MILLLLDNYFYFQRMSSTQKKNNVDIKLPKVPFSIFELIIALLLNTYFVTVGMIEFSLSTYVLQENKADLYHDYAHFKHQAHIWKWWQHITIMFVPLSIFSAIRNLIHIFTRTATMTRNLIDIVTILHLVAILYTIIQCARPLETKWMKEPSNDVLQELNFFHLIVLILNIIGWFIPIFRYHDWKNDRMSHSSKKYD